MKSNNKQHVHFDDDADDDRRGDSPTALIVPNERHHHGKNIARLRKTKQAPRRLPLRKRKSEHGGAVASLNNNDKEPSLVPEKPIDVSEQPPASKKARTMKIAGPNVDPRNVLPASKARPSSAPTLPPASTTRKVPATRTQPSRRASAAGHGTTQSATGPNPAPAIGPTDDTLSVPPVPVAAASRPSDIRAPDLNPIDARPRSAPTLPTAFSTYNVPGPRSHSFMDPRTAPNTRPDSVPTELSMPAMMFPVAPSPMFRAADSTLAPEGGAARTNNDTQMPILPPYAHQYGPSPHTNGGWNYGWAPFTQPHQGHLGAEPPHEHDGQSAPHEFLPPTAHVPAARKKDDDSEYTQDSDDDDDDDGSVSSKSTAAPVDTVCVTQNGGMLLKNANGVPLVLIDSDSADVSAVFRKHKIQVTNLTTSADGNNAINTLKSLATVTVGKDNGRKFQRWTEDEDDLLRDAVTKSGPAPYNWKRISRKYFRGIRTSVQCKNRWLKVLQPGLKRTPWTDQEDIIVKQQVSAGKSWAEIARVLEGRLPENIRERYVTKLDPALKKTPWTDEENEILFKAQARLGNKWVEISKLLPGRSENAVKNRWHNAKTSQRRKIKQLAKEAEVKDRLEEARANV